MRVPTYTVGWMYECMHYIWYTMVYAISRRRIAPPFNFGHRSNARASVRWSVIKPSSHEPTSSCRVDDQSQTRALNVMYPYANETEKRKKKLFFFFYHRLRSEIMHITRRRPVSYASVLFVMILRVRVIRYIRARTVSLNAVSSYCLVSTRDKRKRKTRHASDARRCPVRQSLFVYICAFPDRRRAARIRGGEASFTPPEYFIQRV